MLLNHLLMSTNKGKPEASELYPWDVKECLNKVWGGTNTSSTDSWSWRNGFSRRIKLSKYVRYITVMVQLDNYITDKIPCGLMIYLTKDKDTAIYNNRYFIKSITREGGYGQLGGGFPVTIDLNSYPKLIGEDATIALCYDTVANIKDYVLNNGKITGANFYPYFDIYNVKSNNSVSLPLENKHILTPDEYKNISLVEQIKGKFSVGMFDTINKQITFDITTSPSSLSGGNYRIYCECTYVASGGQDKTVYTYYTPPYHSRETGGSITRSVVLNLPNVSSSFYRKVRCYLVAPGTGYNPSSIGPAYLNMITADYRDPNQYISIPDFERSLM